MNSDAGKAEHEADSLSPAPVVAIAGVPTRIPKVRKDGSIAWQKLKGRKWVGASLLNMTRWAIAVSDGDPTETATVVVTHLPETVLAQCEVSGEDRAALAGAIAELLPDEGFRSTMIDRRIDCLNAYPDVEPLDEDRWRIEESKVERLHQFRADLERIDRANIDLMKEPQWQEIPGRVLRAILRRLGHPRPDNLTRA